MNTPAITKKEKRGFSWPTKFLIVLVPFLLIVLIWGSLRVIGDTTINLTLTTNPDLQSGLVGHWSFDGPSVSGTTVSDVSGSGNDGTISGAGGGSSFTPSDLSNLVVWVDPEQGITLNGNDVSNWEAVNDASIDFAQGTASKQPTYTGSTINGAQALAFAESSDQELVSGSVTHNIGGGEFYQAVVVEFATFDNSDAIGMHFASDDAGLYYDLSADAIGFWDGVSTLSTFDSITSGMSVDTPYIFELWRDSSNNLRGRLNGSLDSDSNVESQDLGTSEALWISDSPDDVDNFDGLAGDIILTSSLPSSAERDDVCAYLSDKYGITTGCVGSGGGGVIEAPVEGKIGQALEFDGVDDYVNVGSDSSLDIPSGTAAAWFNALASSVSDQSIIGRDASGANNGDFNLRIEASGDATSPDKVRLKLVQAGVNEYIESNTTVAFGTWIHAVVTFGSGGQKMYINGILQSDTDATVTTGMENTAVDLVLGNAVSTGSDWFDGMLDDVRVYDRVLSAEEITRLYQLGATTYVNKTITSNPDLENGLVGHWTFDGPNMDWSVTNEALDRSGQGNDGNVTNFDQEGAVPGKIGQALEFDGSDDYIQIVQDNSLEPATAVTIDAWFYWIESTDSAWGKIVMKSKDTNGSPWKSYELTQYDAGQTIVFSINVGGTIYETPQHTLEEERWYHLVGTWQSGDPLRLYVDGVLEDSSAASPSGSITYWNAGPVIGWNYYQSSNQAIHGRVDDVRIYDRVLSADEITRLYQLGATTYVNKTITSNPDLEDGLVGHWTFDGPNMDWSVTNEALDRSGQGNDGNVTNFDQEGAVSGKIGQALEFDGNNDYVDSGDAASLEIGTGDLTLTAWIKTTPSATWLTIGGKKNDGGSIGWIVQINGSGRLLPYVWFDGTGGNHESNTGDVINDGEWYFIAVVYDRDGLLYRYVDGVNTGTNVDISDIDGDNVVNNDAFRIGVRASGSNYFDGTIDDVRVYSRVLSADEIMRLYELGK